jgi:Holliday junction resolvasome RuvABC DNA-binding subunit
MLGFNRAQSQKVLKKLFDSEPSIKVEIAIKKALSMM